VARFLEFRMMYLRGAIWAVMALSVGPELITPELITIAKAEPRAAEGAEVVVAVPVVKVVPAEASQSTAPVAATVAAVPAPPPKPVITLQAKVDLSKQTLTVSERGKVVGSWKISSGVSAEFATPSGVFKPEWTAKMWFSRKYDDAPMPHAVFFRNGAAIHATQAVGRLGTPASHGCVRLAPANAETFYKLVQRHGLAHTQIHVFGNPSYPQHVASAAPRRAPPGGRANPYLNQGYAGWSSAPGPVRYATASPFGSPMYARMPLSAVRTR
jgi:DNA-binding XRE family transcriptional regulator